MRVARVQVLRWWLRPAHQGPALQRHRAPQDHLPQRQPRSPTGLMADGGSPCREYRKVFGPFLARAVRLGAGMPPVRAKSFDFMSVKDQSCIGLKAQLSTPFEIEPHSVHCSPTRRNSSYESAGNIADAQFSTSVRECAPPWSDGASGLLCSVAQLGCHEVDTEDFDLGCDARGASLPAT